MTAIGILLAVIGVAGFAVNFLGLVKWAGPLGDLRIWGAVAVIGAITAVLTRRPGD